jgi:hypothetical protein
MLWIIGTGASSGTTVSSPSDCQPELGNCIGGGIGNPTSAQTGTVQIGYGGSNFGLAAAYTYTSDFYGALYGGNATPLAAYFGRLDGTNSVGVSGYWQPTKAAWFPSVSAGWGINSYIFDSSNKLSNANLAKSQSWYVGMQWADAFVKGNTFGMAVGEPTFVTQTNSGKVAPRDGNYAWEWWYKFQVTDNISVTPALYYLSAPLGQLQKGNGDFNNFGGLVKTTFKF